MKVIDKQNRSKLNEGRSTGMGFAFTKKVGEDEYETVQPISPCKDYLNDVVFSEITGKDCSAYGLYYKKQNILGEESATIAAKILKNIGGTSYSAFDSEKKMFEDNYSNLTLGLNQLEKLLKLTSYTSISPANDGIFLIEAPAYWCQSTYLISMYSLLVRCSLNYKEGDYLQYLEDRTKKGEDSYTIIAVIKHLKSMIEGKKLALNKFPDIEMGGTGIHNHGIMSYNLPLEEDEPDEDDDASCDDDFYNEDEENNEE